MDTKMHATDALADPGLNKVTIAFMDADSAINVTVPVDLARRLATQIDRAAREASGIQVALSRGAA